MRERSAQCHDPIDEVLEVIWVLEERGIAPTTDKILSMHIHGKIDGEFLRRMVKEGLLRAEGDRYLYTESGRISGENIIRRHRLAERLLVDVLNIQDMSMESEACCFEHFLSPEVTDHICTLLGHPRQCPHGNPIPTGPCCIRAQKHFESAVVPLGDLKSGQTGRILYISTKNHQRLDRLTSLGLFPGRIIRVHQREPLFVVFLDETQLALERAIVDEIFVLHT